MPHLLEQAEKARLSSRYKTAMGIYERLVKNPGLEKNPPPKTGSKDWSRIKSEAFLGLADVERIQGYFSQALHHYQEAEKILKKIDPPSAVDAQVGWALAARAVGRPQEALERLNKALIFYRKDKDRQGEAFTHWALGGTLRIAGDMKRGLKELQTALRMFKSLKDVEGISYTCCALGGIFRMLGRYGESRKYYREANRLMRQRKDTFGIAYSYCGLGNVERMGGRYRKALPFYRKAEKLYGSIGDRVSYAYTLWSIGTAHKMLGDFPKAVRSFLKADKLFLQTGDTRGRIYVNQGLGEIAQLSPNNSSLRKSLFVYRNDKRNQVKSEGFQWESLHETALFCFALIELRKVMMDRFDWAAPPSEFRKFEKVKRDLTNALRKLYRKAGSRFYPSALPVNWP